MILNAVEGKPLPDLRRRRQRPRLALRRGPLRGHPARARARAARREVQHRRRQRAHQPRDGRRPLRAARAARCRPRATRPSPPPGVDELRGAQDLRRGPAGPRPALRHRRDARSAASSAGARRTTSRRAWRPRSAGTSRTATGARAVQAGSYRRERLGLVSRRSSDPAAPAVPDAGRPGSGIAGTRLVGSQLLHTPCAGLSFRRHPSGIPPAAAPASAGDALAARRQAAGRLPPRFRRRSRSRDARRGRRARRALLTTPCSHRRILDSRRVGTSLG